VVNYILFQEDEVFVISILIMQVMVINFTTKIRTRKADYNPLWDIVKVY